MDPKEIYQRECKSMGWDPEEARLVNAHSTHIDEDLEVVTVIYEHTRKPEGAYDDGADGHYQLRAAMYSTQGQHASVILRARTVR